jgi:hypothetical protein
LVINLEDFPSMFLFGCGKDAEWELKGFVILANGVESVFRRTRSFAYSPLPLSGSCC